jgi:hypothetical protein
LLKSQKSDYNGYSLVTRWFMSRSC